MEVMNAKLRNLISYLGFGNPGRCGCRGGPCRLRDMLGTRKLRGLGRVAQITQGAAGAEMGPGIPDSQELSAHY